MNTTSLLRRLPPETAHRAAILALGTGLAGKQRAPDDPILSTEAMGLSFRNPVGLAAGFDKDAEAMLPLLDIGFGFVEAGTVTPLPQPGNPKPRVFRWPESEAVINRLGFNSRGLEAFASAFEKLPESRLGPIGANVGKNKDSADAAADYATGIARLAPYADYLTINISSPNTPGLRGLQEPAALRDLLQASLAAKGDHPTKLAVKIAPDLDEEAIAEITEIVMAEGMDGMIVSNTTIARPDKMPEPLRSEAGGLSGPPLFHASLKALKVAAQTSKGRLTLIGAGGVRSGTGAYMKIKAGAGLVQLYTAMIYHGPAVVQRIKRELAERLRADGFASVSEAVGADIT